MLLSSNDAQKVANCAATFSSRGCLQRESVDYYADLIATEPVSMTIRPVLSALVVSLIAACQQQPAPADAGDASPPPAEIASNPTTQPVEPAAPAAEPAPNPTVQQPAAPPPAPAAPIATQPGPNGSEWDLVKVAVTGNMLTVQFNVRTGEKSLLRHFRLDEISFVDDATSQRYGVLRDDSGKSMASPLSSDNKSLLPSIGSGSNGVVWLKFPAPPATSPTISINFPEVAPFDGVAIKR